MPIRSHIDPVTFVVYMHADKEQFQVHPEQLEEFLNARREGEDAHTLFQKWDPRLLQTYFHEIYHFWQGLRLPFLFRFSFFAYIQTLRTFIGMASQSMHFTDWECVIPNQNRLTKQSLMGISSGARLILSDDDVALATTCTEILSISPLDLIECAASLAEFQLSEKSNSVDDPVVFRRWCKRNTAYLKPYEFALKYLGNERLVLRSMLPLINASFSTTIPERAFAELLVRLCARLTDGEAAEAFLAQPEPCRWPELFQAWLDELKYDGPTENSKAEDALGTSRFQRLTIEGSLGIGIYSNAETLVHPLLHPLAKSWVQEEESRPALKWLIDLPRYADDQTSGFARDHYGPPITVIKCALQKDGNRIHWLVNSKNLAVTTMGEDHMRGFVADFITMQSVVRRAASFHFEKDQRLCHHSGCPYFEANYCNSYPIIPEHFDRCGFPARMERLTKEWVCQ